MANNETDQQIFNTERGERAYYEKARLIDELVLLPLTKDGFEAMIEMAAKYYNLPVDDAARCVTAGFVHHIEASVNTTTLEAVARALYKAVVNTNTWLIDQEIKQKHKLEIESARDKAVKEAQAKQAAEQALLQQQQQSATTLTLVPDEKENT